MKKTVFFILLLLIITACRQRPIDLGSLLNEMVDREVLASFPDPPFTLKQFSSYDRATVDTGDSSWFANRDRTMFIRIDTLNRRNEYVMFDAGGPGAVVRFWMTFSGENSGHGILRF